ncbi:MAG: hypothetical protein AAB524_02310 [Patescibacteria group bacterium]
MHIQIVKGSDGARFTLTVILPTKMWEEYIASLSFAHRVPLNDQPEIDGDTVRFQFQEASYSRIIRKYRAVLDVIYRAFNLPWLWTGTEFLSIDENSVFPKGVHRGAA